MSYNLSRAASSGDDQNPARSASAPRGDAELREDVALLMYAAFYDPVGDIGPTRKACHKIADRILALVSREDRGTEGQGTAAGVGEARGPLADVASLRAMAKRWAGVPLYADGTPIPTVADELLTTAHLIEYVASRSRATTEGQERQAVEGERDGVYDPDTRTFRITDTLLKAIRDHSREVAEYVERILAYTTPPNANPTPAASPGESGEAERWHETFERIRGAAGSAARDAHNQRWDWEVDGVGVAEAVEIMYGLLEDLYRRRAPGQEEKR